MSQTTNQTESSLTNRIIIVIGKITAPTGIIGASSAIFTSNSETISVISVATMLIMLIILYHKQINQKVPSSIMIGIILSLGIIFYFGYENILIKDTGLKKYWKQSRSIGQTVGELIELSKEEIFFYGTNFHITITDNENQLLKRLENGVNIKCLVFNPESPFLDAAAKNAGQPKEQFYSECRSGIESLKTLERKWDLIQKNINSTGNLEIRLYDELPTVRAYIFDPKNSGSECIFIPYVHTINSPALPAFQFKNQKTGVFQDYYTPLLLLWQKAKIYKTYNE